MLNSQIGSVFLMTIVPLTSFASVVLQRKVGQQRLPVN
jgi:hypothetical protein